MDRETIDILDGLVAKLKSMTEKAQRNAETSRIIADTVQECRSEVECAIDKIKHWEEL
jgi:hypothetical protein